jgi:hypothetical protein
MRAQGHATVWGTLVGVGRAGSGAGWYQQLQECWAAHKAARREVRLASLNACWDATHEACTPRHANAAPEMAAAQQALSLATRLYGLAL